MYLFNDLLYPHNVCATVAPSYWASSEAWSRSRVQILTLRVTRTKMEMKEQIPGERQRYMSPLVLLGSYFYKTCINLSDHMGQ